jgi:hypothetical protein
VFFGKRTPDAFFNKLLVGSRYDVVYDLQCGNRISYPVVEFDVGRYSIRAARRATSACNAPMAAGCAIPAPAHMTAPCEAHVTDWVLPRMFRLA